MKQPLKIIEPTKETVGKVSQELSLKAPESRDPIEIERAMQEDYLKNLIQCVEEHKKICHTDFFVVVITKNEKLMPNVFRNYFGARSTCPTPDYDQSVYRYDKREDRIEYIWTIPTKEVCHYLLQNKNHVVESERQLLGFVQEFALGILYQVAKKFNGEEEKSPLLEGA